MKIVMFSDAYWPRVNGVTVSVDSYSRALVKEGHEVLIICSLYPEGLSVPSSFFENCETTDKLKIVRVPSMPALVTKEDRIAKFSKWHWVFKQVDIFNPDIIHINTEFVIANIGFLYGRAHNLPVIFTFHTMWEDYGPNYVPMFPSFIVKFFIRGAIKNVLNRSYRVIVPTPQIDEVVKKYSPRSKTFLLPTGIEVELFDHDKAESEIFRAEMDSRYPLLKGKRILLFAGRIVKEKNLGFLLNILPNILDRFPDTILLFAGSGPDLDYYKAEAKKAALEERCIFMGYVERKDLALIYAIADIFVFPSLTDTQGLVTLEAMLSGTPVVAIGALGTLMVMGGDNGGFMVKNDAAEFTGRILNLLEDPELRRLKSHEARIHARSWSIGELTKKLLSIYETTIESYKEDYGEPGMPLWELLMDKRWWKMNNKLFKKKTDKILREMRLKLKK
jgi:hypothetical protein